ncbi:hypothetical protein GCM10010946_35920 [Undibacterium squillarum]|uniref:Uncharacterized protein n=1 Tax=Undibacterium squillarum TaxID=1131567 RepID=A0ABQ2Y3C3_9BURK|nr:hypothetical protein GCM10010946_35920 [Undibacterium squillarum]
MYSESASITRNRLTDYATLRIRHFRRTRLSADNRRIAVLNSAFEVFSAFFQCLRNDGEGSGAKGTPAQAEGDEA